MSALRGWAGAAHPFPLGMVMVLTALVSIASSRGTPDAGRLVLLLAAMLFSQMAIGWSNDYLDREADAVHQPSKPVPSGLVNPGLMPYAIGCSLVAAGTAGVWLGFMPLLLLAVGTACGLAYNLWLKHTRFSATPFVVAFTVLPIFVWTALDVYRDEYLALFAIGLTLPVAVHVANVLPDIETDRDQGRRTIAVTLGRERAIALTMACQFAPVPLVLLSLMWLSYDAALLVSALVTYAGLSAAALVSYTWLHRRGASVGAFRLLAAGGTVFAAGWLAAVQG